MSQVKLAGSIELSISLLTFCPQVLSVTERRLWRSRYNCGLVSSFSSVIVCFMYFEALLLGTSTRKIIYQFNVLLLCHYEMTLFIPDIIP